MFRILIKDIIYFIFLGTFFEVRIGRLSGRLSLRIWPSHFGIFSPFWLLSLLQIDLTSTCEVR